MTRLKGVLATVLERISTVGSEVRAVAKRRPIVVIAFGVLVGVTLVVYVLPALLVGPDDKLTVAERLKAENDLRATLIQALGGAALLAGLYFTGRTFQVNREAQATERFTRAIAQLGDDKLDIRLGGIYALERIAHGSRTDHWPVVEVLTAFVREHAPWQPVEQAAPSAPVRGRTFTFTTGAEVFIPDPPTDLQAVMTVIGRRRREHEREGERLNLQDVDLRGFNLDGAHLERANLTSARLVCASLVGAYLNQADVQGVDLAGASLNDAHLNGLFMNMVNLDGTTLVGADLDGATIQQCSLKTTFFSFKPLGNVTIAAQDLRESGLTIGHLDGAEIQTESVTLPSIDPETSLQLSPEPLGSGWVRLTVMDSTGRRIRDLV